MPTKHIYVKPETQELIDWLISVSGGNFSAGAIEAIKRYRKEWEKREARKKEKRGERYEVQKAARDR